MQMDTEASLREYLKLNLRVPVLGRLGPLATLFDFVANAAPGVKEILTVGKICWELRESLAGDAPWDLIVVDAAATGHVVGQLDAPRAIQGLVQVGPVRQQTDWMVALLSDPDLTALNVVTSPEEMPVNETIELVARARDELTVPLGAVIVNRVLPELFTRADEEIFDSLRDPAALDVLHDAAGPGSTAVLDAARLAVSLRRSRSTQLAALRERGGPAHAPRSLSVRARPRIARHPHGGGGDRRGAGVTATQHSLESLLTTREVVVFCGSGGVGKTSVAAAAAVTAAARVGGKVLVLTIDPARRLADALGLESFGNVERRVPLDACRAYGIEPRASCTRRCSTRSSRGTSWCYATLPTSRPRTASSTTASTTTSRRASSRATTTSRWSGSTSSTRRGRTTSSSSTRRRPATRSTSSRRRRAWPTSSAVGSSAFLRCRTGEAGGGARMLNMASRPFYQVADRILGSQFLQDIAEFFLNFQSM